MDKKLKIGCLVLDKGVEKRIQNSVENLNYDIKIVMFRNFNNLINSVAKEQFDYIFIDIEIKSDDLISYLHQIQHSFPHIVRILLSDNFSPDLLLMANDIVHLILEKRHLERNINDLFTKAKRIRHLLQNSELIKLSNAFNNLVVLKPQHLELLRLVNREESSIKEISDIVEKNMALSTKVLQVANMTVFSPIQKIQSIGLAIFMIGSNILRALIINIQVYSIDSGKGNMYRYLALLERHCSTIAECSRTIASTFNVCKSVQNDSFTAGLLHDVGKLVMMDLDKIADIVQAQKHQKQNNFIVWQAEKAQLGATHAQVGAYFLGIWNFPDEIIDAVAYHHMPSESDNVLMSPLTFVHIAEAMIENDKTVSLEEFEKQLDMEYLDKLGIREQTIKFYKAYLGIKEEISPIETVEYNFVDNAKVKIELPEEHVLPKEKLNIEVREDKPANKERIQIEVIEKK